MQSEQTKLCKHDGSINLNPSCNDGSDSEDLLYVGFSNGAT